MSKFKLGVLVGIGVGVVVAGIVVIVLLRDPISPLTRADYETAVARWREKDPRDYDMHIVFTGGQVGDYDIEVRGGEVTKLLRDGQPLANRGSTWKNWSVPGMFEILETDLGRMENSASQAAEFKISVEFDGEWGYPARYRQIQLGGTGRTSEWHVTQFSPQPAE
jgi:hypothetical protein